MLVWVQTPAGRQGVWVSGWGQAPSKAFPECADGQVALQVADFAGTVVPAWVVGNIGWPGLPAMLVFIFTLVIIKYTYIT